MGIAITTWSVTPRADGSLLLVLEHDKGNIWTASIAADDARLLAQQLTEVAERADSLQKGEG